LLSANAASRVPIGMPSALLMSTSMAWRFWLSCRSAASPSTWFTIEVSRALLPGGVASVLGGADAHADKRIIAILVSRRQIPLLVMQEPMRGIIKIRFTN
jgi:hypothetical protein